jgi:hypothetical protein
MRKAFLWAGAALMAAAVFAPQIGLDNDAGWGRGRVALLALGLVLLSVGWLSLLLRAELTEAQNTLSAFIEKHLNFSRPTRILLVSTLAAGIITIVYFGYARPIARNARGHYNYYSELAIGFKAGHLYLAEEPSPALLALDNPYDYNLRKQLNIEDFPWDVSLYKNRFYIYWGPAPSLLLTVFSEEQLSCTGDHYLALAFACGLFLYSALIAVRFWNKSLPNGPVWPLGVSLLAVGLSTPSLIMLKESQIYEAAIFGCQFFLIGGGFWAYSSLNHDKPAVWKLALAGIHWGLALGTRLTVLPVILFSVLAALGYVLIVFKPASPKTRLASAAALGIPLLLAVSALGWYNWARFDSILETGIKYQLTNLDYSVFLNSFSSRNIAGNLSTYLFHPIQLSSRFPYLVRIEYLPSNDRMAGLASISPFIFLLFAPLICAAGRFVSPRQSLSAPQQKDPSVNWLFLEFAGSTLIAMTVILSFYFVTMRYIEDFMPSLTLFIIIMVGREFQSLNKDGAPIKAMGIVFIALAFVTITANLLVAIPQSHKVFMVNLLNSLGKLLGVDLK